MRAAFKTLKSACLYPTYLSDHDHVMYDMPLSATPRRPAIASRLILCRLPKSEPSRTRPADLS